jgi:hypothetical protein
MFLETFPASKPETDVDDLICQIKAGSRATQKRKASTLVPGGTSALL